GDHRRGQAGGDRPTGGAHRQARGRGRRPRGRVHRPHGQAAAGRGGDGPRPHGELRQARRGAHAMSVPAAAGRTVAKAPPSWAGIAPSVVWVMWRREMLRYSRDRSQIFGGLSRTVLWLVILGFGLGAALREIEGYSYAQYILPGVIVLNVLFAALQCAISLVWDRQVGIMREVFVSPSPMLSVALGKLL